MAARLTLIPMLLLLAASALAQQPAPASQAADVRWFEPPAAVTEGRRVTAYEFSAGGSQYRVERAGRGTRSGAKGPQAFDLHLSKGDFIQVLYYAEYQGDALLLFGSTNGMYGAGFVVRIGGAVPDIKWKQFIPGVNIGRGTIEGDFAYVTARNFIAKLDLRQGTWMWRHGSLGREGAFLAFDPPQPQGERVLFPEVRLANRTPRVIEVEKAGGRILSPASLVQAGPQSH